MTQNRYSQLAKEMMNPPSAGPTSVPSATAVPLIPSARPRSCGGNVLVMIPWLFAMVAAAPTA